MSSGIHKKDTEEDRHEGQTGQSESDQAMFG